MKPSRTVELLDAAYTELTRVVFAAPPGSDRGETLAEAMAAANRATGELIASWNTNEGDE